MSYAGSAFGGNYGNARPQPFYGGDNPVNAQLARTQQMQAYRQSPEHEREMYERGLQQQEMKRREYDSQTARDAQKQKYGVLSGLVQKIGGDASGGYGGGMTTLFSKKIGGK